MDRRNILKRPRLIPETNMDIHIKRAHDLLDNLYYASMFDRLTYSEVYCTAREIIGHMADCMRYSSTLQMKESIAKIEAEKTA